MYKIRTYSGDKCVVSFQDVCNFSGGDRNSPEFPNKTIHTDLGFAKTCGLDKRIASGAMFEGILADLVFNVVGEKWYREGKMRIKFISEVTIGDIIVPYIDRIDIGYDVWCENQNKAKTAVGQAIIKE